MSRSPRAARRSSRWSSPPPRTGGEIDDDGTMLNTLSFNGWIPGPLMICHVGDYIELTLKNPASNVFEHNIDFHASTGSLGGGGLTLISPGEQVKLRYKATKPGTYIYHCAPGGSMIPFHVVSGMNGAVMVLPRDGLKDRHGNPLRYDRAYYIGEQDYYVPRRCRWRFHGLRRPYRWHGRHVRRHADADAEPRGVQRQGRRAHRRQCDDGQRRRNRAVHPLPGQPRFQAAPDRRPRRLRLGAGLLRRPRRRKGSRPGSSAAAPPGRRSIPSGSRVSMCICRTT